MSETPVNEPPGKDTPGNGDANELAQAAERLLASSRSSESGERSEPPARSPEAQLATTGLGQGWLGLAFGLLALPGLLTPIGGEAFDPRALVAWLALVAPAAGILAAALGLVFWPGAWLVPGLWGAAFVVASLAGEARLPASSWALCVVSGAWFAGLALGAFVEARRRGFGAALAGAALLVGLVLCAAPLVAGAGGGAGLAARAPALGRFLLDASPLVVAFETAGVDWTHAHPAMYAEGGVEWVQRATYRGPLAAPLLFLVGSLSAWLVCRRRVSGAPYG